MCSTAAPGTDRVSYEGAAAFVYVDLSGGIGEFGAGADTLAGFENVTGSAGWGDQLIGDGTGNEIDGLGGDDTIVGLGGADELNGGAGADIFMYNSAGEADDDFALLEEIEDFVSGSGDVIHLAHIDTDLECGRRPGLHLHRHCCLLGHRSSRSSLQRGRGLRRHRQRRRRRDGDRPDRRDFGGRERFRALMARLALGRATAGK